MNEVTFVGKLGAFTFARFKESQTSGRPVLIAQGNVEEKQVDAKGACRRCDMRLATSTNRKLVSGEMKRPEVADGRDPRNENLISDARNKAVARGLPLYFTCNMAEVVLFEVSSSPQFPDREVASFSLAPIKHSSEVEPYLDQIHLNWLRFLEDLERHLSALDEIQPAPTNADVIRLQEALFRIAEEGADRAERFLRGNPTELEATKTESGRTFGYPFSLNPVYRASFRQEIEQVLRLAAFVVAQKLILHRVLATSGKRMAAPFTLDEITVPHSSTDPSVIRDLFHRGVAQAIRRSKDFETAFLATPNESLLFLEPDSQDEVNACRVGEVWDHLLHAISSAAWSSISHNLVGFLYEAIVDPDFRHALGQHYTPQDVVDLLTTFAITNPADIILDPAAGGGSFLSSAYRRKRAMGASHSDTLAEIWGCELSSFAAELSTVTLATADPTAPSAYPRVLLKDFFDLRPGMRTALEIPGEGRLSLPRAFDGVIGNPPYISYRHQTNQVNVLRALEELPAEIYLPKLTGKSDEYVWFLVHATQFLRDGGRLGFVVSSALLFSDYGIPLIRFLARHFRIMAVVDSMVERWFVDADTNTVLLLLERCSTEESRSENTIRFLRFRRPLSRLLPAPHSDSRRDGLEGFVELLLCSNAGENDPRFTCIYVPQGTDGGLVFAERSRDAEIEFEEDEE